MKERIVTKTASKKQFTTLINAELCKACCYCVASCPKEVFAQGTALNAQGYAYVVVADTKKCNGCLTCINICPDFAITVEEQAS